MLDRNVLALVILAVSCAVQAQYGGQLGYYEGGTIFWEARNPNNPREITVKFEFHFDSRENSATHSACSKESIWNHKKLRTGGQYKIGTEVKWADYYCTYLDSERNEASGYYIWTYTLPDYEDTAQISYTECCWIPGILNNGRDIGSGKGWNLASAINIDHGDNTINSPPKSKTFAKYPIMSGCGYTIHIPSDDANNDKVKCRWTKPQKGECNENGMDICGKPYFDEEREHTLAALNPKNCILTFGNGAAIPAGTYALMVMLEDYAEGSKKPISKTPVHFLMEVFQYEGDCRQPGLNVPDGICLSHVVGQEFSMRMVATATSPNYRITSIDVQGHETETPVRVAGTESDYEINFSFTPEELRVYTICAMAFEDYQFVSTQSCFNLKVVEKENMPGSLRVDRENSIPARNEEDANPLVNQWAIKFSRGITKGVFSPAYVTVEDAQGNLVWRVDATGPDAKIVNDTLTFPASDDVFLEFEAFHTITFDEGVVQSDNGCSVKSSAASWGFVTGSPAPSYKEEPLCTVSSMAMFLLMANYDLGEYGPEIIHLRDPGCTAVENGTHYIIFTSYGQCGTTFARDGDDFTYSNIVYIPEHPYRPAGTEVTRFPHKEVRFTCSIPARTVKTLEFEAELDKIELVEYNGRAGFLDHLPETSLQLFEDRRYRNPIETSAAAPVPVPFGNRLYFQGKAVCPGSQPCDAHFQSCWATVSENPYDKPRHDLITDACIEDGTLQMHDSPGSHKTRFSVDAFAFLGWRITDTVYVHCNVIVCDSNDYLSLCKRACSRHQGPFKRSPRDRMTVVSSPGLFRRQL